MLKHNEKWVRYYNVSPDLKTIAMCESHGSDHSAYNWCPQVDPRWSEEQQTAYWKGYNK